MNNEESVKSMKGNKDDGVFMNVNGGDLQNFDTQHNSGGSGIVVMKGGKPELYGQVSQVQRGVPTKEELRESNDPIKLETRVTALPDMLGEDVQEERDIPVQIKKIPKQVTRIDVMKESNQSPPNV